MSREGLRRHPVDVLVIGAGGAGLRAAMAASEAGCEVVVLSKRSRLDAHTVLASGGINAALGTRDAEDSWQQHFADTLHEGYLLGNPRIIGTVVREAPGAVAELAGWGCPFTRTDDGRLDQRFFGAHRWRRTCFAGDWTGRAIITTLGRQVQQSAIRVMENQCVASLLVADGACFGAIAFDLHDGARTAFLADAVVLCGGGHTRLWRRSSSRADENFGDGIYLGAAAGCRLQDLELVQFHPTGMVAPEEAAGTLVTEAVRGEGGQLRNAQGDRFMVRYDPGRMELSTRDRVALASYTEIAEGRGGPHGGVFLDISHRDKDFILERLPRMYRQFIEYQLLDISKEPMEVAPTAHYTMGGLVVDPDTHETDVIGLFAAGECTAGLHGANRLGGTSLTETIVYGRRAGEAAAAYALGNDVALRPQRVIREANDSIAALVRNGTELARAAQRELRDLLWEHGGVVRSDEGLRKGLSRLEAVRGALDQIDVRPTEEGWSDLAQAMDLRAGIALAEVTLQSALVRTETRGCHNRSDFPDLDADLQVNFQTRLDGDDRAVAPVPVPVPPVPVELEPWLTQRWDVELAGRLLE
jgi:succinate dehydrogenase / fumarate reductase flavoprotein subunit